MAEWVLSVAGIAILSVICDVILPEGETRKYIRTVFGIAVTLVIVQPVVVLLSGNTAWDSPVQQQPLQQSYVESVSVRQEEQNVRQLKEALSAKGIEAEIDVSDQAVTVRLPRRVDETTEIGQIVGKFFPEYELRLVWV